MRKLGTLRMQLGPDPDIFLVEQQSLWGELESMGESFSTERFEGILLCGSSRDHESVRTEALTSPGFDLAQINDSHDSLAKIEATKEVTGFSSSPTTWGKRPASRQSTKRHHSARNDQAALQQPRPASRHQEIATNAAKTGTLLRTDEGQG